MELTDQPRREKKSAKTKELQGAAVGRAFTQSRPLFVLARKGWPEIIVHGLGIFRSGDSDIRDPLGLQELPCRSLLAPWYYLTAGIEDTSHFLSLALVNHLGHPNELEELTEFLTFSGADESDLFCPRIKGARRHYEGRSSDTIVSSRLLHPSAGRHLLLLTACRMQELDRNRYWSEGHPLMKRLYGLIGKEAGEKVSWIPDNCGLPTAVLKVKTQLSLWHKLAHRTDSLSRSMMENWVNRAKNPHRPRPLDLDIMAAANGSVIAKEGEDGLLVVQTLPDNDRKQPTCSCFVKLASGHNPRHLAVGLWSLLDQHRQLLDGPMTKVFEFLESRLEKWLPQDQDLLRVQDIGIRPPEVSLPSNP